MTSRALTTIRIIAVSIAVWALVGLPVVPSPERLGDLHLAATAGSESELIERLLGALATGDLDALHALRATESEWKAMFAWQVPTGTPPRVVRTDVLDLAWGMLDAKSHHYERYLIQTYGGRFLRVKTVAYAKGTEEWAGYRVHRQLRLGLVEDGGEVEVATGSVVDVGGRWKFASFVRD